MSPLLRRSGFIIGCGPSVPRSLAASPRPPALQIEHPRVQIEVSTSLVFDRVQLRERAAHRPCR
jgi:hypothetical protein